MASFEAWFKGLSLNRDLANFNVIESVARQAWEAGFASADGGSLLTCSECGGPMPFGCDCPSCGRMTRAIGAYKPPIVAGQMAIELPADHGVTVTDDAEADVPTFVHSE